MLIQLESTKDRVNTTQVLRFQFMEILILLIFMNDFLYNSYSGAYFLKYILYLNGYEFVEKSAPVVMCLEQIDKLLLKIPYDFSVKFAEKV